MAQSLNLSANDYLVIAGIVASAYIVYKVSGGVKSVTDVIDTGLKNISDTWDNAVTSADNLVNGGKQVVGINTNDISSLGTSGLSDARTFNNGQTMDPTNPLDPFYTSGRIYSHTLTLKDGTTLDSGYLMDSGDLTNSYGLPKGAINFN